MWKYACVVLLATGLVPSTHAAADEIPIDATLCLSGTHDPLHDANPQAHRNATSGIVMNHLSDDDSNAYLNGAQAVCHGFRYIGDDGGATVQMELCSITDREGDALTILTNGGALDLVGGTGKWSGAELQISDAQTLANHYESDGSYSWCRRFMGQAVLN